MILEVLMNVSQSVKMSFSKSLSSLKISKNSLTMMVFILALAAFEAFNYSTTDFALADLLGDLRFAGIRWATLLALAFCGIDFAGIARLLAPQTEQDQSLSVWFMFGAWILAATMNAILTWWGVVLAIQAHPVMSTGVVDSGFVTTVIPIMIALMVWVIRILLVATLTKNSARVLNTDANSRSAPLTRREIRQAQSRAAHPAQPRQSMQASFGAATQSKAKAGKQSFRPDPKYIPIQGEGGYSSLKATGASQR
jgi:hypothetical protein